MGKTINQYSQVTPTATDLFLLQRGSTYYKTPYSNFAGSILTKKITIPTASVLTLNTIPYSLIAAPGVGYAIQVIGAVGRIATYGGSPYATNTTFTITTDTATQYQATSTVDLLTSTVARIIPIPLVAADFGSTNGTNLIENKALMAKISTGNATAGNSDIIIYLTYRIITL